MNNKTEQKRNKFKQSKKKNKNMLLNTNFRCNQQNENEIY